MKIQFVKSPVGAFLLGYVENDIAEFEEKLAAELLESGFGIEVVEEIISEESTEEKPKKKK